MFDFYYFFKSNCKNIKESDIVCLTAIVGCEMKKYHLTGFLAENIYANFVSICVIFVKPFSSIRRMMFSG